MKLARTTPHWSLLACTLLLSPPLLAQELLLVPGWYGGLGVGPSRSNIDEGRITSRLLGGGLTVTGMEKDNSDTGYKLYGGYQFGPHLALEGGYFDLGRFGFNASTTPAGTLHGDIRLKGLNLDLVGRLPFTERFSAIGRAGLTYVDTVDRFSSTGAVTVADPSPDKREGGYKVGLGLQYELSRALALRLEAERYRVNDAVGNRGDIDLITVGLVFRFGGPQPEPAQPAPAPAPAAERAAPQPVAAPVPAPVPPPRVLKRVVIAADNDFGFDKVSLSPSGKRTLDAFARDLRGLTYERITVIGNTDRFGTESYNMKLSQRRADAVKDYLVVSGGVPASKIVATGAGESDHRTVPSDCVGQVATTRMIECLQPDRRVDIEVIGTR
ncbi:MAG: OmpA family protein [Hylemonella sp.]|uniref:OmpA family protein n=1 Tax=Hylemonella sp. TaxID=2066020 RepID=UPI0022C60CC3|nr:OmpA family protein [Hylemonella sp.]MCZ8252332.1 OmpA family protein [Hylemonella sp.]